jgi:hypothetical protein
MTEGAALPPRTGSRVLDDLAEVIGEEAAFALAAEFLGEQVYIPKDPATEPGVAAAIGDELAAKLCGVFGGETVAMPSKVVIERRVVQLAAQGVTKREIARQLKIRQPRVFAILKRHREAQAEANQPSLF